MQEKIDFIIVFLFFFLFYYDFSGLSEINYFKIYFNKNLKYYKVFLYRKMSISERLITEDPFAEAVSGLREVFDSSDPILIFS